MFDFVKENWDTLDLNIRDNFLKSLVKIAFADDTNDDAMRPIFEFALAVKSKKALTDIANHKNMQRWMLNRVLSCNDYEIQSAFLKYCKKIDNRELYSAAKNMLALDISLFKSTFFYRLSRWTKGQRAIILEAIENHYDNETIQNDYEINYFCQDTQLQINSVKKRLKKGCLILIMKRIYGYKSQGVNVNETACLDEGTIGLYLGSAFTENAPDDGTDVQISEKVYEFLFGKQIYQISDYYRSYFKVL